MIEALINMAFLFAMDIALIVVVSWVTILLMESDIRQKCRRQKEKLCTYLCRYKSMRREDRKNENKGIILLFILIAFAFAILCTAAYYIPFEKIGLWNIIEKFINEHALLTNIFGTLIAIIIIYSVLRPKFIIDKKLDTLESKGKTRLKVRIRNLGFFPIINIDVLLLYYREVKKGEKIIKRTKKLELLRPETPILQGLIQWNADHTYGCGTELSIEELLKERKIKINEIDTEYEGIICRVKATHPISGVTYVREHKFEKNDIDEYFAKHIGKCKNTETSIQSACDRINNDIDEIRDQINDIKNNVIFIQKENHKN